MKDFHQQVQEDIESIVQEWIESDFLQSKDLFVVGCSTSEIAGKNIGTSGSEDIAAIIFAGLQKLQQQTGIQLVFQCCEHLNRALVIERDTMQSQQLEEVSVVPIPTAGGSMASYAFRHMKNPVVVEEIQSDAGMDIGETMIGMQLKRVAVPLRFHKRTIGNARTTAARTRPKLIGGERASYKNHI